MPIPFKILIEDCLLTEIVTSTGSFKGNERLLSLINDFEDNCWRYDQFQNYVWDNVAMTALSAEERETLKDRPMSELVEAAKKLRITPSGPSDPSAGGELGEIVLYGIMKDCFNALSAVPKIFYKQSAGDYAKGADSVHITTDDEGEFALWLGESKFYKAIEDVNLPQVVESVASLLDTEKLKKETTIITGVSDIDKQLLCDSQRSKIKSILKTDISIDEIKSRLHVPILLLHECERTAKAKECSKEYMDEIVSYQKERAEAYFKAQIKKIAETVPKYTVITFHLILFPVPNKEKIFAQFHKKAVALKPNG